MTNIKDMIRCYLRVRNLPHDDESVEIMACALKSAEKRAKELKRNVLMARDTNEDYL